MIYKNMSSFAFEVSLSYFMDRGQDTGVERTSLVTSHALRRGLEREDKLEDKLEREILRRLWGSRSDILASYLSVLDETPEPAEIAHRYHTIREEVERVRPEVLLVVAAGLSPLGYATARRAQQCLVMDTDLPPVIAYRKQRTDAGADQLHPQLNYFLHTVDVLNPNDMHIAATALRGMERLNGTLHPRLCIVAEGLTYYLSQEQQKVMHHHLQSFGQKLHAQSITIILDYYTDERTSVERMKEKGSCAAMDIFALFDRLAQTQYASDATAREFLLSQGYKKVTPSPRNTLESPHRVWRAEMG